MLTKEVLSLKKTTQTFSLRIDPLLLKKLKYISAYNGRSKNKEIEMLVKNHISSFEKKFGPINENDLEDL